MIAFGLGFHRGLMENTTVQDTLAPFIEQCHAILVNDTKDESKKAREYLSSRNILPVSITEHKLGYCPATDPLPENIRYYGREPYAGGGFKDYSYFIKHKIIVPIYGEFNRLIGFATRTPTHEPGHAWWNLPFKKGEHLFLLNKTRKNVFDQNKIYVVEGYMDAVLLYQVGLKEVVSLMGTVLSPRKIGLMLRYCSNVCFCMDTDKNQAGQNAQEKAIYTLKQFAMFDSMSIINGLPVDEDPDVYVTNHGLPQFLSLEKKLTNAEIKGICDKVVAREKK